MNGLDLFMFMGQSNMAGRGISNSEHPETYPRILTVKGENVRIGFNSDGDAVSECTNSFIDLTGYAGYEFRAISDPKRLYPMEEPFGALENRVDGIDDSRGSTAIPMKTGSMVTSFTNAWYEETDRQIVGVSASKGGSSILEWQPGTSKLNDAIERLEAAKEFLAKISVSAVEKIQKKEQYSDTEYKKDHISSMHTYMVWCQGETDGDHGMSAKEYIEYFRAMYDEMKCHGVEHLFLIQIGEYNGNGSQDYREIQKAQQIISDTFEDVTMVSTSFKHMKAKGLMKDDFHYFQQAYNEVGAEAGKRAGELLK